MGMQVGEKASGLNSEINITPLADVMLVLLIIVMLIAPLLQAGVTLTLPEASNTSDKPDNDNNTVVAVTADGRYFVDNVQTPETELLAAINRALDRKFERILLIKGDVNAQVRGGDGLDGLAPAGRHREHRPDHRARDRRRGRRLMP